MWYFPRDHSDLVLESSHFVLPPSPFWIPWSAQRIFPLSFQDFKKCFYSSTGLCVLYMTHFSHLAPHCLLSSPPHSCSSFLRPDNSQPSSHVFFCVWAAEFSCSFLREHGWSTCQWPHHRRKSRLLPPPFTVSCLPGRSRCHKCCSLQWWNSNRFKLVQASCG